MKRLVIVLSLAALSTACGSGSSPTAPALPSLVPDAAPADLSASGRGCEVWAAYDVPGFPVVARAFTAGCPRGSGASVAAARWTLESNPDGVAYRVYANVADLIADRPSPNHEGPLLRVHDWIHGDALCFSVSVPGAGSRLVGMNGTPSWYCGGAR